MVKVCVCSLIGPDSTSNASIWVRAGGARSAIGAVFKLLLVGQPLGPGADVAAIPTAATITSVSAVTAAIRRRLAFAAWRKRRGRGNRSMVYLLRMTGPLALRHSGRDASKVVRGLAVRRGPAWAWASLSLSLSARRVLALLG